ncbi:MAG: hypothetical protein RLZZ26_29 [Candidatus Parcubacteria bacterium]
MAGGINRPPRKPRDKDQRFASLERAAEEGVLVTLPPRGPNVRAKKEAIRMAKEEGVRHFPDVPLTQEPAPAGTVAPSAFSDEHLQELQAIQRDIERRDLEREGQGVDVPAPSENNGQWDWKSEGKLEDLGYSKEDIAGVSRAEAADIAAFSIPRVHDVDTSRETKIREEVEKHSRRGPRIPTVYPPANEDLVSEGLAELPYAKEEEEWKTPFEWKKKLKGLVGRFASGAKEKAGQVTEEFLDNSREAIAGGSEDFKKAKGYLAEQSRRIGEKTLQLRDVELTRKIQALGKNAGESLLKAGEWYRKLPLKYKVAVSGALFGASLATGGASTLVTLLSAAKLGQRSLSSLGTYALVEGTLEKRLAKKEAERGTARTKFEKWKKHGTAATVALAIFSGVPGLAIKEGWSLTGLHIPDSAPERISEWLKHNLAFHHTDGHNAYVQERGLHAPPAHVAPVPERVVVPPVAPQTAEAPPPAAATVPSEVSAASSASSPAETLPTSEGTPEAVPSDAVSPAPDDVQAPVPAPEGQAPEPSYQDAEAAYDSDNPDTGLDQQVGHSSGEVTTSVASEPEVKLAVDSPEMPDAAGSGHVVPETTVEAPTPGGHWEIVPDDTADATPDTGASVHADAPTGETPIHDAPIAETVQPGSTEMFVPNKFGVVVPEKETGIYRAAKHVFVYGGSDPEKYTNKAKEYLLLHPKETVYGIGEDAKGSYRLPIRLVNGEATYQPKDAVYARGLRRVFSSWLKVSGPGDFSERVKLPTDK